VKPLRIVESSENLAGEVYSVVVGVPEGRTIKMGDELRIPAAGKVRVRRVRQPDAITAASASEDGETILRLDVEPTGSRSRS
jgi:hypothetical protein